MGIWKRRPQLREPQLRVWRCGLLTTGKLQVTEKEQRIESLSKETHLTPAGSALPNSVYPST